MLVLELLKWVYLVPIPTPPAALLDPTETISNAWILFPIFFGVIAIFLAFPLTKGLVQWVGNLVARFGRR